VISTASPIFVVIIRYASDTGINSVSNPYFPSSKLLTPPLLSSGPQEFNSWREVSNSNLPLTKLVAKPPGKLCCSNNNTLTPCLAASVAAVSPPLPAPITTTS
jgi:hypothetical protein